jgi:hypothetical protein
LQSCAHEAELRVDPILVNMQALGLLRPKFEAMVLTIASDAKRAARSAQRTNEALGDGLFRKYLPGKLVLAYAGRRKIHYRPTAVNRFRQTRLFQFVAEIVSSQ